MTYGRSVKEFFLLLISHQLLAIAKCCPFPNLLPDRSLIALQLIPDISPVKFCSSLPSSFWYSWVDGDAYRSPYLCTAESVLLKFFIYSEASKLNPPSNIVSPDPIPSSVHEPSKIFLTEDLSGWPSVPYAPNLKHPAPILEDIVAALPYALTDTFHFLSYPSFYVSHVGHLVPPFWLGTIKNPHLQLPFST